jgi:hypothetical protein
VKTLDRHLLSPAYPINELDTPRDEETFQNTNIEENQEAGRVAVNDVASFALPEVEGSRMITFVFSTNAANINLKIWKPEVSKGIESTEAWAKGNNWASVPIIPPKKLAVIGKEAATVGHVAGFPNYVTEATIALTRGDLDGEGRVHFPDKERHELWSEFTANFVRAEADIRFLLDYSFSSRMRES